MSSATIPTSIRLTPAEKRKIATAARKRGLSPAAYIKRAALDGATPPVSSDAKLERLAALVHQVCEAVEDELDYCTAVAAWDRQGKSGEKLLTGDEARRASGL